MVNFKVNGIDAELGAINTGLGYVLDRFTEPKIRFLINGKESTIEVRKVIEEALAYIDRHCGMNKQCNKYFSELNKRQPVTLRQILDSKTIQVFRLRVAEGTDENALPAGYTMGWGDSYAQIGVNERMLTDKMSAASLFLHELAHVAGAPGRRDGGRSIAAETALMNCGMQKLFDKDAWG